MDSNAMETLCREASQHLKIDDDDALAAGERVDVDGVSIEMLHTDGAPGAVLLMDVGVPPENKALDVFRLALQIQLLSAELPHLRFGYNPFTDSLVMSQYLRLREDMTGEMLAIIVRAHCAHVKEWRESLLNGELPGAFAGADGALHRMPGHALSA